MSSPSPRGQRLDAFLDMFGPLVSPLRRTFLLGIVILVGAASGVILPKAFVDSKGVAMPWTVPVTIVLGCMAATAVLADRVADAYDKRTSDWVYRSSETTAEASVNELNGLLSEAIESTFTERTARATSVDGLKRNVVRFAANSIGPGTRATYYTLLSAVPGGRILGQPSHWTTLGRQDAPERPWIEHENPNHEMWRLLDAPDQHQSVRSRPEEVGDTVWGEVAYDTFLTVPIKAHGVVFGVLTVNNSAAGAIGDAQRAVIISMARTMALTLAFNEGAATMKSRDGSGDLSLVAATLFDDEGTEGLDD